MPIYEFFCEDCHTLFNFYSSRPNTEKRPDCPRCGRPRLPKMPSLFTTVAKTGEEKGANPPPGFDEAKMERLMSGMMRAADQVDENDPRQMAALMRDFAGKSGLPVNEAMDEALSRMESGEDPERIEADMGELLDKDDPFAPGEEKKKGRRAALPPRRDERLYEL